MLQKDCSPVEDLNLIHWGVPNWRIFSRFVHVGWIGSERDFPVGAVPDEFVRHLWGMCQQPMSKIKGYQVCGLCESPFGPLTIEWQGTSANIGDGYLGVVANDGVLMIAPDLVFHYVVAHGYVPPREFIDGVIIRHNVHPLVWRDGDELRRLIETGIIGPPCRDGETRHKRRGWLW
jgi:hypothetical protein